MSDFNRAGTERADAPSAHSSRGLPTVADDAHTILVNKVSWGAIFAGVVVGLVVQVLLTMLGVGIGIATLDPGAGAADNPAASTFSIGAGGRDVALRWSTDLANETPTPAPVTTTETTER